MNKIITNGTSAGGALSSLMGATGNHPDHADMAYEWEFSGEKDYCQMHMKMDEGADLSEKAWLTVKEGREVSMDFFMGFPVSWKRQLKLTDAEGMPFYGKLKKK